MLAEDRFSRQRRVAEVGSGGQAMLCRLTATLPNGASADVAATYLSRAGVQVERCSESPARAFAHAHIFADGDARALAAGAHAALVELRHALELDAPRWAHLQRGVHPQRRVRVHPQRDESETGERPSARERVLFP